MNSINYLSWCNHSNIYIGNWRICTRCSNGKLQRKWAIRVWSHNTSWCNKELLIVWHEQGDLHWHLQSAQHLQPGNVTWHDIKWIKNGLILTLNCALAATVVLAVGADTWCSIWRSRNNGSQQRTCTYRRTCTCLIDNTCKWLSSIKWTSLTG